MKPFASAVSASLCVSLAGCASAPHAPPSPTVTLPDVLAQGPEVTREPPAAQWWHLYREPALDALVEQGLANNRDLRVAAAHLLQARAVLGAARGQTLPDADVTLGAGYGSTLQDQIAAASHGGDPVRTGTRIDPAAGLSWELDLFGRLRAGIRAARADAGAQAALTDGVRVAVAAGVTDAWLRACGYGHREEVARAAVALARQGRDLARHLRDAGQGMPMDAVRAEAELAQAEAAIPPLEAARYDALVDLAVLTGGTTLSPAASTCTRLPMAQAAMPVGDGVALLRRRPDLRAAEQALAASTARIGVAVADLYPRVSLGAGAAVSSPDVAGLAARNNLVWQVGPLLSWRLPNIGVARARIAQARAGEIAALASFDAAILNAFREVNQAAQDYGAALRRQAALREAANQSGQAQTMAQARRAAGAITALDLLEVRRGDVAAQAALAGADADVAGAQVVLFKALGGGWEAAPPVTLPHPERSDP